MLWLSFDLYFSGKDHAKFNPCCVVTFKQTPKVKKKKNDSTFITMYLGIQYLGDHQLHSNRNHVEWRGEGGTDG